MYLCVSVSVRAARHGACMCVFQDAPLMSEPCFLHVCPRVGLGCEVPSQRMHPACNACRALVVARERQVSETEQRLQDVRAEARQAKREAKLLGDANRSWADTNRELSCANRELETSRSAALVRADIYIYILYIKQIKN